MLEQIYNYKAIDSSTCSVVVYEERNHVPPWCEIYLVTEDAEGWTPVVKGEEMSSNTGIRIPVIKL